MAVASAEWMPCVQLDAAGCSEGEIGLCFVSTQHNHCTELCFHPLRTLVDIALPGSCAKHMESGRIGRTLIVCDGPEMRVSAQPLPRLVALVWDFGSCVLISWFLVGSLADWTFLSGLFYLLYPFLSWSWAWAYQATI